MAFACDAEHVVSAAHLFHCVLFFFFRFVCCCFFASYCFVAVAVAAPAKRQKAQPIPAFHTQTTAGMM